MSFRLIEGERMYGSAGTGIEVLMEGTPKVPDWTATLRIFLLDCPGQSPAWNHYLLSIIHLRPIEGVKPAVIRFPHASHEVLLVALDPRGKPSPTKHQSWRMLRPTNLMEQVQLDDDDQARELLGLAARSVVDGSLWAEPPLSGQVEPWRTALIQTSAHLRGEEHAL